MTANVVSRNVRKYLLNYAEKEVLASAPTRLATFDAILVVPVFDESLSSLSSIIEHCSSSSCAYIFVFNVPAGELPIADAPVQRTRETLLQLQQKYTMKVTGTCSTVLLENGNSLYVLDYTKEGLPPKQGVGLARKLGMDLALKLIVEQQDLDGKTVEWIHSSDADVSLPDGYFEATNAHSAQNIAALIYPFKHIPQVGYELSTRLYEFSLCYYVDRLKYAGSPYAFHTIGSLIVVSAEAYATVRGVPKRAGGEDFYLLNKLAKTGTIKALDAPVIEVEGRPSERVPFGTGPALNRIQSYSDPLTEFTLYHPRIFDLLKGVLTIIADSKQSIADAALLFAELRDRMSAHDAELVIEALQMLKLDRQLSQFEQKNSIQGFQRAFHTWFDAFVTLRFVHILRDKGYASVSFNELETMLGDDIAWSTVVDALN